MLGHVPMCGAIVSLIASLLGFMVMGPGASGDMGGIPKLQCHGAHCSEVQLLFFNKHF